jgi:Xaa-Pro aminopeptidase
MDKVFYPFGKKDGFDQLIINWMKTVSTIKGRHNKSIDIADGSSLIGNLRLIKDSNEIEILKQACEISANAHIQAMKTVKAGMNEQFIEALYLYEFAKQGGRFPAYTPIVAGGDNACVLHYVDNNKELNNSDLLLVDAGCEYEMYASDITRTFPVSGKFSSEQLAIYNIVLDALHQATACVKVGNNVMDPQIITEKVITKGLIELGILKGDADKLYKDGAYKDFYMHKFGHWMGLDVHDAGDYMENDDFMSFKAGMVTTVEPGIYISKDADVEDKWKGIGIRIEDDILVTESGNINLTEKVPSDPKEIEALMA